jgi:hypothetical protein
MDKSSIARALETSSVSNAYYFMHFLAGIFNGDGKSAQPSLIASELGRDGDHVPPVVNKPAHDELLARENILRQLTMQFFTHIKRFAIHGRGYEQTGQVNHQMEIFA